MENQLLEAIINPCKVQNINIKEAYCLFIFTEKFVWQF